MKRKIVFLDMDNVLVDFQSALNAEYIKKLMPEYESVVNGKKEIHYDDIPEIFSYTKPVEGAVEAVKTISQKYDVYILSDAPWGNPIAWVDKLEWVKKYFDSDSPDGTFYKRLVLSKNRKNTNSTDAILVDACPSKHEKNHIYFNQSVGDFRDWTSVVDHLMALSA